MAGSIPYYTGTIKIPNFILESGEQFDEVQLAYERSGHENGPVLLVCHALTGDQHSVGTDHEPGWWNGLIHDGGYIDLSYYQVITFNVLGGCNGSTGPSALGEDGIPYKLDFPKLTIRDLVEVQFVALNMLGVSHLKAVIGGSLGGMQVLEWGLMYPEFMDAIFPIAVTSQFSDYAIAFNHIAMKAIEQDLERNQGELATDGMSLARMVGMVSYRSDDLYSKRFARGEIDGVYDVESYLDHQGDKLARRFNPISYLRLLEAMNGHDIGRNRGGYRKTISQYRAPVFALGFKKDLLFPISEISRFVSGIQECGGYAEFYEVDTIFGHDGFLVEFHKWGPFIQEKLASLTAKAV
ncbi:homoserine O-acetyltransferase [Filobacillus milosensis]|uniref:Homoserine O-acetyltransferase n=1 Tax=Filobacillus milosensis TaxID=94137 RepID=A0A4Y8IRW9_9BACI|nr:homoserine O-acetyltransferase [Filobacillus milosensis]TFB21353.1 homoserine O-acetyltransferase [Filobacillus milosensis]